MIRRIPRINELNEDERCEKHQVTLANTLAEKEQIEEFSNLDEEVHAAKEEELPFQDILADQRRKYNSTQKYVQLIYNDLVKIFVKKWEGTFLRKTIIPKPSLYRLHPEDEENNEDESSDRFEESSDYVEATIDKERSSLDQKLYKPDEMVEIVFVNGNSYTGRISKQKMEGQGLYRWHHGSQYKGAFEDNKIQGKGTLEWQDCVRYDGDFENGYQHGKGTMVDKNHNLLYIGEWQKGCKHGKGFCLENNNIFSQQGKIVWRPPPILMKLTYCRFEKNDSYEGDWVMDKREGIGIRLYPNGARYIGDWKNNVRHGKGTMTWPNGNFYQGEWNEGQMHGYGEYAWNRFFNQTFCWAPEICYKGQWHQDTRNGEGQMTINSIGGAMYSGIWKKNKKHGCGTIIGNNGDVTTGDPLFENDILQPFLTMKNLSQDKDKNKTKENNGRFVTEPTEISEARVTSVLKPEQCPSLSYYIDRLQPAEINSLSRISLISGKCRKCEDTSCCCLRQSSDQPSKRHYQPSRSLSKESKLKEISSSATSTLDLDHRDENLPTANANINDSESMKLEDEERWAYNCIAMHMPRIRKVYDVYSKIFCNESPKCRLSMCRLSLWQLWRDCGIHKKNLSLVQIDKYLAANKSTLMDDPHCPYRRIQIWQLIHALLEVSWHLYTKNEDKDEEGYPGRLANGLHKFLVNDVYPNVGNSTGVLCGPERDIIPMYPAYQLYKSIGKPHTARQLLKTVRPVRGTNEGKMFPPSMLATSNFILEGRNSVNIGKNLNYLSSGEPALPSEQPCSAEERDDLLTHSLLAFGKLGATEFIKIMSITCPSIKDPETEIIVNMEYELTFLEFLEIFIEAGKRLVCKKNMERESDRKKNEALETTSMMTIKEDRTSNSAIHLSDGTKSTKSRKKLVKKH